MGIPFTNQPQENVRLETLKRALKAKSKVEVLRQGLSFLEEMLRRQKRIQRWQRAAKLVAKQSARVNREFQKHSLIKKAWPPK